MGCVLLSILKECSANDPFLASQDGPCVAHGAQAHSVVSGRPVGKSRADMGSKKLGPKQNV